MLFGQAIAFPMIFEKHSPETAQTDNTKLTELFVR
ncbi:hypothetical protein BVRB_4g085860 [Beta vulgaris subsp. vulgaris]|nr:hypothetical protein BVRB_4g085860 [Beta vulgaris subsp. vulgaris]